MEVYALVGPAGTGKSHRATMVAHEHQIDLIVDDGLLVQGSRIVAGSSAKREPTKMAAVRRAIFTDPLHRDEVRDAIRGADPDRLLVIGTSEQMVHRIVETLGLPDPVVHLSIHDVASPEEIRQARRVRRQYGKHVIPAPTFEVKKSFSGFLIDPLRFFYRSKRAPDEVFVEKSMVRPTFSSLGRFFISDTVVSAIAEYAAGEVDGIAEILRSRVESVPDGITITLDVGLRYGVALHDALRRAQRQAREMVELMSALNVVSVDVIARRIRLPGDQTEREAFVDWSAEAEAGSPDAGSELG